MDSTKNIGFGIYPQQDEYLEKNVIVTYNFNRTKIDFGKIIRCDIEEPFKTIIKLDDGRILLSTECQYTLV